MSQQFPIPFGEFDALRAIGKGGMGSVWAGHHRRGTVPVAIKALHCAALDGDVGRELFVNEVRAVASLNHPAVVMVLEHGETCEEAERASGGDLPLGTPYVVMELCSGGTLSDYRGQLSWPGICGVVLTLLDALGHAHARGVIHRDIKPSNVLVGTALDQRPGLKLSDFGIAELHDLERGRVGGDLFLGSPPYAPPEQLLGRGRDMGPWSDLYSLGCLVWSLLCGNPPHAGLSLREIRSARALGRLPEFMPLDPVPQGFMEWLLNLLKSRPEDRFECAADAAWALRNLLAMESSEYLEALSQPGFSVGNLVTETMVLSAASADSATCIGTLAAQRTLIDFGAAYQTPERPVEREDLPEAREPFPSGRYLFRSPIPEDWRRFGGQLPPMRLLGAGPGLFPFRTVPLVGREDERDVIWDALTQVTGEGQPRAVVVRGASGVGKSRLVRWMVERAQELGAASSMRIVHSQQPSPRDGLWSALERYLGTEGLSRGEMSQRVAGYVQSRGCEDPFLEAACCELLSPGSSGRDDGSLHLDLSKPSERWQALAALLQLEAGYRPVIVWIDDAQWAGDALGFALRLLKQRSLHRGPVLLLVTCRDEGLLSGSIEEQRLEALGENFYCREIGLSPLDPGEQLQLVGEMLRLDIDLAREVVTRTGGNPLFAVQLVGDWVRRGVLTPTREGFARSDGAEATIPDDIHGLWSGRFTDALGGLDDHDWRTVELSAALGSEFRFSDWIAAAGEAAPSVRPVLDRLLSAGLLMPESGALAFVHAMARESLERRARDAGRWKAAHLRCAAALAEQTEPAAVERRARHLVEGGEAQRALPDLAASIDFRIGRGEAAASCELLDLQIEALDDLGAPALDALRLEVRLRYLDLKGRTQLAPLLEALTTLLTDCERADNRLLQARVLTQMGKRQRGRDIAEAECTLERAVALAEEVGDGRIVGEAALALAWALILAGRRGRACELLEVSSAAFARDGHLDGVALCYGAWSEVYAQDDDLGRARHFAERALRSARAQGHQERIGGALDQLARVAIGDGATDEAWGYLRRAKKAHGRSGSLGRLATTYNLMGELARKKEDFEEAGHCYRESLAILEVSAPNWTWQARMNLALLSMEGGDFPGARWPLDRARETLAMQERPEVLEWLDLLMLPVLLGDGDFKAFEECLARVEGLGGSWRRPHADPIRALGWAVPMARRANREDQALRLDALLQAAERQFSPPS